MSPSADGPSFPLDLLTQPPEIRAGYFADYTVAHDHLMQASQQVLDAIYQGARAPIVNLIGPTGVGKTLSTVWLRNQIVQRAAARMEEDSAHLPCVYVAAPPSTTGRFDWADFYLAVLIESGDPFAMVNSRSRPIRELRRAYESALRRRTPVAVIVDEAQHMARAASHLDDLLDVLKYLGDETGVVHVLVGTYQMRVMRKVNAQLGRRSRDVHLRRYDARDPSERQHFQSVVREFQFNLPVATMPDLVSGDKWEYLYARTIGCVGTLKDWLRAALDKALHDGAKTITDAHLRATQPTEASAQAAFVEASDGENEFAEDKDAGKRLYGLMLSDHTMILQAVSGGYVQGLLDIPPDARPTVLTPHGVSAPTKKAQRPGPTKKGRRPGQRNPVRDAVGSAMSGTKR